MLDDAADVVQREIRQAGVFVACEHVFATFPNGLVHVHAGTVVADHGLGHERSGLAVGMRHVPYGVFQDLQPVGAFDQSFELGADFALARRGNFVVMHFHLHALLLECQAHGIAHVLQ